MTSKLSFRARALDASKALPIYRDTEIPESADCSNINRTVPQMPTGMEKEEESEHHLQQAICTGTTIPTPEVFSIDDLSMYDYMYPPDYKTPRQLIYMQPFSMEADIPDYDMDSDDEVWISGQSIKLELTPDKFEEMMDRLEKGSGQTVVTLQEAKALIKEDDDLIIAVYDYWLTKRLKTQHHLIPQVRTEARLGISNHNPYIAFRRRTEKMQTRKNRKNDESSYEKMLKLRRDLCRAVTLLEMVKKREKSKREHLHLSIEVFEKRYQAGDFSGNIINEALSQRPASQRPAFTQLYQGNHLPWSKDNPILASLTRKEKRQYKKRRHKSASKPTPTGSQISLAVGPTTSSQSLDYVDGDLMSSEEEVVTPPSDADEEEAEGPFPFRRRLNCLYNLATDPVRSPPRSNNVEEGTGDKYSFFPASTKVYGHKRYIGSARRRFGRGGRLVIDRQSRESDDNFWRSLGFNVFDSGRRGEQIESLSSSENLGHTSPVSQSLNHEVSLPRITDIFGNLPLPKSHMERSTLHRARAPSPSSSDSSSSSNAFSPVRSQKNSSTSPFNFPSSSLSHAHSKEEEVESSSTFAPPKLAPPKLAPFIGTVCSTQDSEMMFFEVANLLADPQPHRQTHDPPYFLVGGPDVEDVPLDTTLLDKTSADLCNMQIINDSPRTTEWFEFPDLTIDSQPPFDLGGTESDSECSVHKGEDNPSMDVDTSGHDLLTSSAVKQENATIFGDVVSNSGSTVSINVLLSPDSFVTHSKTNGEALEANVETNGVNQGHGNGDTEVRPVFTEKYVHHTTNGEGLDVEEGAPNGQGQGSDALHPEVVTSKPLPLSPAPQNGVAYLRDQFVTECADKTQRFKNLVFCPEIGI